MTLPFNHSTRLQSFDDLIKDPVDLLIIGGGITGAGIARDAAMRGLRVGIIDRSDFAYGTSSRSSKLIHGGLRYLSHFAFGLIRQSSLERRVLHGLAPHLCEPLGFCLPLYKRDSHSLLALRAGLFVYDVLCSFTNFKSHKILGSSEVGELHPYLTADGLKGGGYYFDALTNDARLTLANIRSAARAGAAVLNYVELLEFETRGGKIIAARIRDRETGKEGVVHALRYINAGGPWVDRIRTLADSHAQPWLRLSKGSHIVLPHQRLPIENAIGFSNPADGRTMFLIPWAGRTVVGTTETDFEGDIDDVDPTMQDVDYLLDPMRSLFPESEIGYSDVLCSWSGLRPLVGNLDGHASDVRREHRVEIEPNGLLSVAGGKLTTYRSMAEEVLRVALEGLETSRVTSSCTTMDDPLVVDPEGPDLEKELRDPLVSLYGPETKVLARMMSADTTLGRRISDNPLLLSAQVAFALEHEMALHVNDVLTRRLPHIFQADDLGARVVEPVAQLMGQRLGWDDSRVTQEIESYTERMAKSRPHR